LGDAIGSDDQRLAADHLMRMSDADAEHWPVCDGYHCAISYCPREGLFLSVDPLGLFPIYYYYSAREDALVVATSCELALAHPCIERRLDGQGLAGILLTNGLVANRPLMAGMTRLGAGHVLRWIPGAAGQPPQLVATEAYRPPIHGQYRSLSFNATCQLLDERLSAAIRRQRPREAPSTLMLSGGLDSRLLAGYLAHDRAVDSAVILGRDTDFEVRTAEPVARAVGLPVEREAEEPTEAEFFHWARHVARWEHLAGGYSGLEVEPSARTVARAAPYVWTGYAGDLALGGSPIRFGYDRSAGTNTLDRFLAETSQWGITAERLGGLLASPDGHDWVQSCVTQLRDEWERGDERPWQRSLRMRLHMRIRHHIGAVVHRLSHHSWPLIPFVDRSVLDVVFNVAEQHLRDRQLQYALVNARFPALAALAQDSNSFSLDSPRQHVAGTHSPLVRAAAWIRRRGRQWYWRKWRGMEPRRYYRYFHPDGPYWQCVRQAAESHRRALDPWLRAEEVERLWPPPHFLLQLKNPFAHGSALRLLLGLAWWLSDSP
jgi:asparagine synthase (glutamine-hydrolysing)